MIMTPEEKYRDLYEQMYDLCEEQGWGDPFSYARSREIYMAGLLGHKVADDYSGEDAIDEDGGCEYKSTIGKSVNGTYNGISVQDTWELQEKYIVEDKIGKYLESLLCKIQRREKLKKSGSWVAMLYWIYYYQRLRNSLMKEHHTRKTLE